jgi:RHS repeat-associated protein
LNNVRQTTIGYDAATGRIATMLANGSNVPFTWSYLPGSDLKSSLAYPNGLTASWTYDADDQLLQVRNAVVATAPSPSETEVISQYDYAYDNAGRRISCAKSGSSFTQNDALSYGYNEKSELTNAVAAVDSDYHYLYDFDDIGNRESAAERGVNVAYSANNLNQYTAVDDFVPQFDEDGNQTLVKTATGIWSVVYNGENRPVLWTLEVSATPNPSGPSSISMSYDRMGRRVMKNDQRFAYDGYLQVGNIEHQVSGIKHQTFIWDPTESVATRPLVWDTVNAAKYYIHDGSKNVSEVIATDGSIAAHYEYAPFGAVAVQRGEFALDNPWRFSSEYAENDTATVYYNFRNYDSLNGRWLIRDPIYEFGGANLYCMLWNESVDLTDSLGMGESYYDSKIYIEPRYVWKEVPAGVFISAPGTPIPMKKVKEMEGATGVVLVRISYDSYCDSNVRPHIDNMQVEASDVLDSIDSLEISVSDIVPKAALKVLNQVGMGLDLTLRHGWSVAATFEKQESSKDYTCVEKSATVTVYREAIGVGANVSIGKTIGGKRVSTGGGGDVFSAKVPKASKKMKFKYCCCTTEITESGRVTVIKTGKMEVSEE